MGQKGAVRGQKERHTQRDKAARDTRTGNTKTQVHTTQKYQRAGCVVEQQASNPRPAALTTLPPLCSRRRLHYSRRQPPPICPGQIEDTKSEMTQVPSFPLAIFPVKPAPATDAHQSPMFSSVQEAPCFVPDASLSSQREEGPAQEPR